MTIAAALEYIQNGARCEQQAAKQTWSTSLSLQHKL
jgi:hypothetical protein